MSLSVEAFPLVWMFVRKLNFLYIGVCDSSKSPLLNLLNHISYASPVVNLRFLFFATPFHGLSANG